MLFIRSCGKPLFVEFQQSDGGRYSWRFARHTFRLIILTPFGPFELLLSSRRELPRRHDGGCQAVLDPLIDRHQRLTGKDPPPEQGQLRRFGEELDPNATPGITNQFQHVRLFGRLSRILDDNLCRPPVRKLPYAVAPLDEPDQVEEADGLTRVEPCPSRTILGIIERTLRQ